MSEILYYLCQLDSLSRTQSTGVVRGPSSAVDSSRQRVSVLVFVVRQWARSAGVTSTQPGQGFTNFMLTVLVVFFLQTRPSPLLPPLRSLKSTTSGLCAASVTVPRGQGKLEKVREFEWSGKVVERSGKIFFGEVRENEKLVPPGVRFLG